jgi:aryl-alcohol dehydrogenase-like predicted oxidoreductase
MRERRIGDSGPVVSVVGLGCNNFGWRIDVEQSGRVVAAALDAGITLFDTAESVIAGATTPEQVRANVAAGEWVPSLEELAELRG